MACRGKDRPGVRLGACTYLAAIVLFALNEICVSINCLARSLAAFAEPAPFMYFIHVRVTGTSHSEMACAATRDSSWWFLGRIHIEHALSRMNGDKQHIKIHCFLERAYNQNQISAHGTFV